MSQEKLGSRYGSKHSDNFVIFSKIIVYSS